MPEPETLPPVYPEAPPPPRGPGWTAFIAVLVIAIAALVSAFVVPMFTAAPAGDGGVIQGAYITGTAVVTDCGLVPTFIAFEIRYVNLGNTTANNVMAQYTVYQFETPTITRSGTISIGTVPALTAGSVSGSVSTLECGLWGHDIGVSFSWT